MLVTPIIEKLPHGSPKVAYSKGGDLRDHEDVGTVENQKKFWRIASFLTFASLLGCSADVNKT